MIELTITDTLMGLAPLILAIGIYLTLLKRCRDIAIASARMVLQLLAIGFALTFIFEYSIPVIGLAILSVMIIAAAIIAARPLQQKNKAIYLSAALALAIAGGVNLVWILLAVLKLSPWYQPQVVIPLAGMVFANGMNAISLAAERYEHESRQGNVNAPSDAFNAAMIPQINGLLAVGLVSLPGMMTGQILSGVSPLVAVRYQILIMSMIASTSIMSVWLYFWLLNRLDSLRH